jgi:hypothetical protein
MGVMNIIRYFLMLLMLLLFLWFERKGSPEAEAFVQMRTLTLTPVILRAMTAAARKAARYIGPVFILFVISRWNAGPL